MFLKQLCLKFWFNTCSTKKLFKYNASIKTIKFVNDGIKIIQLVYTHTF